MTTPTPVAKFSAARPTVCVPCRCPVRLWSCDSGRNCGRTFALRRNDTFCRNHICSRPIGRVRAWICRSRIYVPSTASSRETTTCIRPLETRSPSRPPQCVARCRASFGSSSLVGQGDRARGLVRRPPRPPLPTFNDFRVMLAVPGSVGGITRQCSQNLQSSRLPAQPRR